MVAGLNPAASSAFSHNLFHGKVSEREQVTVSRVTAGLVDLIAIWLKARAGAGINTAALDAGVALVIASLAAAADPLQPLLEALQHPA